MLRLNRGDLAPMAICMAALLVGTHAHAQAPTLTASPTQTPTPIAVDVYKEPRPTRVGFPECSSANRAIHPLGCKVLDSGTGGWTLLNLMVDPSGRAFEVAVVRSSGNKALDEWARQAIEEARFSPGTLNGKPIESCLVVKYLFWRGLTPSKGATREFIKAYDTLRGAIRTDDRAAADAAMKKLVVTNMYEDAYLGMATYFYATRWGDEKQQLEGLTRAIAGEAEPNLLPQELFKSALQVAMKLQADLRQYAEALATFKRLQKVGTDAQTVSRLTPAVEQLEKIRSDDSSYAVPGEMPEGSWHLGLFKRHFRAEVTEGSIAQAKLRCQKHYVTFAFDPQLQYQVDSKDGDCSIELLGAAGTRFNLIQF